MIFNLAGSARCWQLLGAPPARGWPPRVRAACGRREKWVEIHTHGFVAISPSSSSSLGDTISVASELSSHLLHSYFIECFIIINTTSNSYPTAAEAAYTDAAAAVQREMLVRCEIEGLAGLRRYMLAFSMSGRHGRALTCCLVRTASLCGVPLGIPTRKRGELLVTRIEAGAVRSVRTFGCPPPGKHQSADHTTDHPPANHEGCTLLPDPLACMTLPDPLA